MGRHRPVFGTWEIDYAIRSEGQKREFAPGVAAFRGRTIGGNTAVCDRSVMGRHGGGCGDAEGGCSRQGHCAERSPAAADAVPLGTAGCSHSVSLSHVLLAVIEDAIVLRGSFVRYGSR